MAGASAKSIGGFAPTALQGMLVDIPLAITEGLKALPNHLGATSRDHGAVTDAKSGATVAGKSLMWGFVDGLSDVVMQPIKGAQQEGPLGAVKGLGKGLVSLTGNTGAGMFGLFAYSSQGIATSIKSLAYRDVRKAVSTEQHREGMWMIENAVGLDADGVLRAMKA